MTRYIKEFLIFSRHISESRELLLNLTINNFKKQYLGSYFGLVWAFVQPLTFMVVIWFVFTYGFRAASVRGDTPFFLWLTCGMIPWFFISNALTSGVNAVTNNSFLVRKVFFRVSILPLVSIGSILIIHLILLFCLIVICMLYGFNPSVYWLQLPYFLANAIFLILGVSWLTSAVRVFVKDVAEMMGVLLQIGFWATPIFWDITTISPDHQWIFKLNPAYYIIQGYRNTFINHIWFWETATVSIYFISISSVFFVLGAIVFKRLRPHFGDVL